VQETTSSILRRSIHLSIVRYTSGSDLAVAESRTFWRQVLSNKKGGNCPQNYHSALPHQVLYLLNSAQTKTLVGWLAAHFVHTLSSTLTLRAGERELGNFLLLLLLLPAKQLWCYFFFFFFFPQNNFRVCFTSLRLSGLDFTTGKTCSSVAGGQTEFMTALAKVIDVSVHHDGATNDSSFTLKLDQVISE